MTDAPSPPVQAVKPQRRQPQPHKSTKLRGKPIGHGSGRAVHGLKPHVDEVRAKI
jgi:hypothetical protein